VVPLTEQVAAVEEVSETARCELALAVSAMGAAPKVEEAGGLNVMVWDAFDTVTLRSTKAAATKVALPGCDALSVQVPAATTVTVSAEAVQMAGVRVVSVTASFDEALGATTNGGAPKTLPGGCAKVIDCAAVPACATGMPSAEAIATKAKAIRGDARTPTVRNNVAREIGRVSMAMASAIRRANLRSPQFAVNHPNGRLRADPVI